jgi:hypothetical protein
VSDKFILLIVVYLNFAILSTLISKYIIESKPEITQGDINLDSANREKRKQVVGWYAIPGYWKDTGLKEGI